MEEWIAYRRSRKAEVGATSLGTDGYTWIKVSDKPSKWMLAHRWAMEQKLGRPLLPTEHVHHVCHDRPCFDQEHLELIGRSDHMRHHQTGRKQPKEMVENRLALAAKYWATPGNREAHGEKLRAMWQDPAYRAKLKIGRKKGWVTRKASGKPHNAVGRKDSVEVRQRRAKSLQEYWLQNREKATAAAHKRWADPVYRAKQAASLRARWDRAKA